MLCEACDEHFLFWQLVQDYGVTEFELKSCLHAIKVRLLTYSLPTPTHHLHQPPPKPCLHAIKDRLLTYNTLPTTLTYTNPHRTQRRAIFL